MLCVPVLSLVIGLALFGAVSSSALAGPDQGSAAAAGSPAAPPTFESVRALMSQKRQAEARFAATQLIAQVEATEGESLAVADAIDLLLEAAWRDGKNVTPEVIARGERAIRIKEQALGPNHLEVAETASWLGNLHKLTGDVKQAQALLERSLAIREQALGSDHADLRQTLTDLGNLMLASGENHRGRELHERALQIAERTLPQDNIDFVRCLAYYGVSLRETGELAKARTVLERAVATSDRALGPDAPTTAMCLINLANVVRDAGDIAASRPLYERALGIHERTLGPDHPKVAISLMNLGDLLLDLGDEAAAKEYFERARAIREKTLGADHLDVASSLNALATWHKQTGDLAGAEALYERTLGIVERTSGPESQWAAIARQNLGEVRAARGDLAGAKAFYEQALAIQEKALGPDYHRIAATLRPLAKTELALGDPRTARAHAERALLIDVRALGPESPDVGRDRVLLARALWALGEPEAAFWEANTAERIGGEHLRSTERTLTERQALRYAANRISGLDLMLSIALENGAIPHAAQEVGNAVVRGRALVLDEMAARHRAAVTADDPDLIQRETDLSRARAELARLMVSGPSDDSVEAFQRELAVARQKREAAERALAERSADFRAEQAASRALLSDVAAALPRGSALVSFLRFERWTSAGTAPLPVPSYAALVIRAGGTVPGEIIRLGTAAEIDAALQTATSKLGRESALASRPSDAIESEYRAAGEVLRRLIWDPVAAQLGTTSEVLVVPDGALSLIDLAMLPARGGGYLAEHGPLLHYLSTERDLLPAAEGSSEFAGLLALGEPDFDATDPTAQAVSVSLASSSLSVGAPEGGTFAAPYRGAHAACRAFADLRFEPLRAAAKELSAVVSIWERQGGDGGNGSGATELRGAAANEAAFKARAPGHRVLHLATHGFFLDGRCASATTLPAPGVDMARTTGENPLLLSGLALAGANRRTQTQSGEEDGILTAEEIASLDLRGVEWAVLSACDTGLGEIAAGEGVLGLRRGFQVAGARTLIMSLWSVDDRTASRWMQALYEERWGKEQGTAAAVRAANLRLLAARRAEGASTHPYYWSGFIAAGPGR